MSTEDLMKLADKFAFFMPGSEEGEKARQALLDALQVNAGLVDACGRYEAALMAAFPNGAHGEAFTQWNEARKLLAKRAQAVRDLLQIHDTQTLTAGQAAVADAILAVHDRIDAGHFARIAP